MLPGNQAQAALSGHHSEALLAKSTPISPQYGAFVKPEVIADFTKRAGYYYLSQVTVCEQVTEMV